MPNPTQKPILISCLLALVLVVGVFFFYQNLLLNRIANLESKIKAQEQEEPLQKPTPTTPDYLNIPPPEVKTYILKVSENYISPGGMSVLAQDKIEFKIKNTTQEAVTFVANPDFGIEQDITIGPDEEKSIIFTAPSESGEHKFIIKTSQNDLEGLLMVRE